MKRNERTTTTEQQPKKVVESDSRGLSNNHVFDKCVANQWFPFNLVNFYLLHLNSLATIKWEIPL